MRTHAASPQGLVEAPSAAADRVRAVAGRVVVVVATLIAACGPISGDASLHREDRGDTGRPDAGTASDASAVSDAFRQLEGAADESERTSALTRLLESGDAGVSAAREWLRRSGQRGVSSWAVVLERSVRSSQAARIRCRALDEWLRLDLETEGPAASEIPPVDLRGLDEALQTHAIETWLAALTGEDAGGRRREWAVRSLATLCHRRDVQQALMDVVSGSPKESLASLAYERWRACAVAEDVTGAVARWTAGVASRFGSVRRLALRACGEEAAIRLTGSVATVPSLEFFAARGDWRALLEPVRVDVPLERERDVIESLAGLWRDAGAIAAWALTSLRFHGAGAEAVREATAAIGHESQRELAVLPFAMLAARYPSELGVSWSSAWPQDESQELRIRLQRTAESLCLAGDELRASVLDSLGGGSAGIRIAGGVGAIRLPPGDPQLAMEVRSAWGGAAPSEYAELDVWISVMSALGGVSADELHDAMATASWTPYRVEALGPVLHVAVIEELCDLASDTRESAARRVWAIDLLRACARIGRAPPCMDDVVARGVVESDPSVRSSAAELVRELPRVSPTLARRFSGLSPGMPRAARIAAAVGLARTRATASLAVDAVRSELREGDADIVAIARVIEGLGGRTQVDDNVLLEIVDRAMEERCMRAVGAVLDRIATSGSESELLHDLALRAARGEVSVEWGWRGVETGVRALGGVRREDAAQLLLRFARGDIVVEDQSVPPVDYSELELERIRVEAVVALAGQASLDGEIDAALSRLAVSVHPAVAAAAKDSVARRRAAGAAGD